MTSSITTAAAPTGETGPSTRPAALAGAAPLLRVAHSATGAFDDPGRSLRLACLVWVALWSFGLFMNNIVGPLASPGQPLDDAWPWPANPIAFAIIAVSIALFFLSKQPGLPAPRLVDLALVHEVLLAVAIGVVNQWTPNVSGLSWIVVVILLHPLIVPTPMAKALAASLAAASMDFVGLAIAGARGAELPPLPLLIWTYLPNYLAAVLAVLPAHIRFKMEEHHAEARELGSYKVGELLGRGGMGEVYRAEHRMLVRPAAVKIVRPESLGAVGPDGQRRMIQRFEREARVTAGLRSPHTVAVYDYGVAPDGRLYYVMELLDGLDLESLVQRFGPVPAERAVHILLQVCDSLGEAHERGLIHRDIKPSNVFLSHYGRHVDFVKVVDFGLARPAVPERADAQLTAASTVLGTPAFMAPEQVIGTPPIGPETDIYAVGCVAYWLVTGQHVYHGAHPVEVLAHHVSTPPLPPSHRTELAVPDSFDRLVLACLEKAPEHRPRSAAALAALLRDIQPLPSWTDERAQRWWEANLASNLELTPTLTI